MSKSSAKSKSYCKDVLPIPQFKGTCWFNSLLMSLFYSELMRNFFIKELSSIKQKLINYPKSVFILEDLLLNNYHIDNKNNENFYNVFKPESILKQLNKSNPNLFYIGKTWIDEGKGWNGSVYIDQLFRFLDIKEKVLYFSIVDNRYMLSEKNSNIIVKSLNNYDISYESFEKLSRKTSSYWKFMDCNENNNIKADNLKLKQLSMPHSVDIVFVDVEGKNPPPSRLKFENATFILDSMIIGNFNMDSCGKAHQIAGITCKSKKYLYNGWMSQTKDRSMNIINQDLFQNAKDKFQLLEKLKNTKNKALLRFNYSQYNAAVKKINKLTEEIEIIKQELKLKLKKKPCDIVRFNWNTDFNSFCIDHDNCTFPKVHSDSNICFNVKKGDRSFLYVRDTYKYVNTEIQLHHTNKQIDKKKCPNDKVLNPLTKRCVLKTGVKGKSIMKSL